MTLRVNPNAIEQDQGRFDFPQVAVVSGSYVREGAEPEALAGHGAFYASSGKKPYFKDSDGATYDLSQGSGGGGGGSGSVVVLDEGVLLGSGLELDFVGAGVDATISGSRAQISIPGGGGGAPDIYNAGALIASSPAEIDFDGGVDVSVSGSRAQVQVGGLWTMSKSSSQTLSANTDNDISFDVALVDSGDGVIDLANNRFIAPADGFYLAIINWQWENTVPSASANTTAEVNGSQVAPLLRGSTGQSYNSKEGTVPLELAEGDYVTMIVNPAGSTPTARGNAGANLATAFSLVRVG